MSADWVMDIADMHAKFGVNDWQYENKDNKELMKKYIAFGLAIIQEKANETIIPIKNGNEEKLEVGLFDINYFDMAK